MGALDGAEISELVGLYLMNIITQRGIVTKAELGLYRDDGIICTGRTARQIDNMRKKLEQTFREHGLEIIVEPHAKVANFLDVSLDLSDGTFRPYRKPGNVIQYVDFRSNHPPAVIKNIPINVEKYVSSICATK